MAHSTRHRVTKLNPQQKPRFLTKLKSQQKPSFLIKLKSPKLTKICNQVKILAITRIFNQAKISTISKVFRQAKILTIKHSSIHKHYKTPLAQHKAGRRYTGCGKIPTGTSNPPRLQVRHTEDVTKTVMSLYGTGYTSPLLH